MTCWHWHEIVVFILATLNNRYDDGFDDIKTQETFLGAGGFQTSLAEVTLLKVAMHLLAFFLKMKLVGDS
jgi:hypothetical protein